MDTQTAIVVSVGISSVAALSGFIFWNFRKSAVEASKTAAILAQPVADGVGSIAAGVGNIFQAAADRLSQKTQELNALRIENQRLVAERERIKNQKVNVNSVEVIFKVALGTFDMQYVDFQKRLLSEQTPKVGRNEKVEYVGVIRKDYKQTLGVDFKKLRFSLDGRSIAVKGLFDVEVIGFKDAKTEYLLTEKRTFKWGSAILSDSAEIGTGYENELKEQLAFIEDRMSHNKFADDVDRAIGNMALSMIRLLVGQTYTVQPVDDLEDGWDFIHLLDVINSERDAETKTIAEQIEANEQKVLRVENELLLDFKHVQSQVETSARK